MLLMCKDQPRGETLSFKSINYRRTDSMKSPASGAGKVSKTRLMSQVGNVCEVCARKAVCLCSRSGGGASIRLLT